MTFRGRIRVLAAAAAATLALLVIPSGASAGVTIGDTFAPDPGCAPYAHLQSTSPGDEYAAPSAGVITSWSYQAGANPVPLKFKVGRHLGGDNFRIVGESPVETPLANRLNSFPVQIPVEAGDVIGNFMTAEGECFVVPAPGYGFHFRTEDAPPGTTAAFSPPPFDAKLDIAANLETKKCKGAAPTMAGTAGNDTLVGTPGKDVIVGLAGKDRIKGLGGKDKLCGLKGKDRLKGGGGNDKLKGGKARDRLVGGGGRDKCVGGKGDDIAKKCEVERSI